MKNLLVCFSLIILISCGGGGTTLPTINELLIGDWEETFNDITPDHPIDGGVYEGWSFFRNGTYNYYDVGNIVDFGTYVTSDDSLIYTASDGKTYSQKYEVSENLLVVYFTDGSGMSDRFVRVNVK